MLKWWWHFGPFFPIVEFYLFADIWHLIVAFSCSWNSGLHWYCWKWASEHWTVHASSQDMFPAVDSIQKLRSGWFSPPHPQRDFVYANTSQIDHLWKNQWTSTHLVKTNDLQLHHLAWLCRERLAKSNPFIWIQFLGADWQISLGAHWENLPHIQDLTIALHNQKSDNPISKQKATKQEEGLLPSFFLSCFVKPSCILLWLTLCKNGKIKLNKQRRKIELSRAHMRDPKWQT